MTCPSELHRRSKRECAVNPNLLAQPLDLGGSGSLTLRNRFVMTPHLGRLGAIRLPTYLARRAPGYGMAILPAGAGMLGFPVYPPEIVAGLERGRSDQDGVPLHPADPRYANHHQQKYGDVLGAFANAVQQFGSLAIGQVHHPGAEQSWDSFAPAIAPSAIRGDEFGTVPHALTAREIGHLIDAYVDTSASIVAAGFDGVELHASHGYLLNRFISPYYNRRTDEWAAGPTLLARLLEAIRERVGDAPSLSIRLQADEEITGGLTTDGASDVAVAVAPYLNFLSVSIGNHTGLRDNRPATSYTSPWLNEYGPALDGAQQVRRALSDAGLARPLLVTGRITSAAFARGILENGVADMVGLARALIADPDFPAKAIAGKDAEINRCIGCNECVRVPLSCPVNPDAGREGAHESVPVDQSRRIAVIGAGPAGANLAIRAADRGHDVVLIDRADGVGGMLRKLVNSPLLSEWSAMIEQLERRVAESGVEFRPGVVATEETVSGLKADRVVWATGSIALPLDFDADSAVHTTEELLEGKRPPAGVPVVVVGGAEPHLEPFIAADLLSAEGWSVTLISERPVFGTDIEPRTLNAIFGRLMRQGVRLMPMTRPLAWERGVLRTEQTFGGRAEALEAGAVVLARGRLAAATPADADTPETTTQTYLLGDALAPRRMTHAALEGARFGANI